MYKLIDKIFDAVIKLLTLFALLILVFIIIFIFKESIVFFKKVSILKFITGRRWNPLKSPTDLSILNIILGTLYVSFIAIVIALPIGVGTGLLLSTYTNDRWKIIARGIIDILAGVPSVVYGFMGLLIIVKFFETAFDFPTGESILAGGLLLSVMILPYIISTCLETMDNIYRENLFSSEALGTSKIYMARKIVFPESKKGIIAAVILALGRAMGETMAVMMVIGNAPIPPRLFGRAQTIPSLIALEMGMVEVGSLHYHALFASGLVLMIMLLIINIIFYYIKKGIHTQ
ncbi:MAG: phosphate ABC transporter permease subunit PstC [Natronincolaceae bacterium]|jgi:phosphate transport system permease protein